jgi:hypothetical protein
MTARWDSRSRRVSGIKYKSVHICVAEGNRNG